jgi:hypothetical protein
MFRPTTPIQAGLAQAFDTSGLVQFAYMERQKRQERLQKHQLEYDPSKIWDKHIPEYQRKYNQVSQFARDHQHELLNASENMDVWREYKGLQNDVKNFVALAAQDQQNAYRSLGRLADPKYFNAENEILVDSKFKEVTDPEFYSSPEWSRDITPLMSRNVSVDLSKSAKILEGRAKTITELDPEIKAMVEKDTGGKYLVTSEKKVYDRNEALQSLQSEWQNDPDIQYRYPELGDYVDDVLGQVKLESDLRISQVSKGRAGAPPAGFYEMTIMPGVDEFDKPKADIPFTTAEGLKSTEVMAMHTDPGTINVFPQVKIRTQYQDLYSLRDGAKVADPEKFRDGVITKSATMRRATRKIVLETVGGIKKEFNPGDYLPDYKNSREWKASRTKIADIEANSISQETAMMYAGADVMEFIKQMQEAEMDETSIFQMMADERAVGDFVLVPFSEVFTPLRREIWAKSKNTVDIADYMDAQRISQGKVTYGQLYQNIPGK